MRPLIVQIFLLAAAPIVGERYAFDIVDLGGNKLASGDGRITELVLASTKEIDRAQKVGDNTPDYCLADPKYRMITALEFASHHSAPVRAVISKVARRRAESAARALQSRYDALQIKRDAGADVFVVTDFESVLAQKFGVSLGEHVFEVFVLNGKAELVRHWSDVPTREALETALRAAAQ